MYKVPLVCQCWLFSGATLSNTLNRPVQIKLFSLLSQECQTDAGRRVFHTFVALFAGMFTCALGGLALGYKSEYQEPAKMMPNSSGISTYGAVAE
jgi:hypothetical protein